MSEAPTDFDELDQLAEAFLARLRNNERPALSEYTGKYPALADRIRELFPALAALERFGAVVGAGDGPAVKSTAPARLGEYKIIREIGRGGMGVVYEAVQESLGRHVALKVLTGASPNAVARFQREARIAARLHHTNIVPVFGVGAEGGTLFYAMQFIVGQGMNDVIAEVRRHRANETPFVAPDADTESATSASRLVGPHADVFFRNVARLMAQAADGLAYAHEHGVLHRDLKPSNMLLDAQGTVWIADFGLARGRDEDDLTNTGDLIGTLRYMAPECFSGPGDVRSDVYSLGATFYEVLTQRPAFPESDRPRLIEQVLNSSPRSLHHAAPGIPADLHTIVQKAMAKSPADRYPSATALADDLRRFLEGRPILARRLSAVEQARRWVRRNPLAAGLTALVLVVALLGAGISGLFAWFAHERAEREHRANITAQIEKARAEGETLRAEGEQLRAEWLGHAGLMTSAQDEWMEFNADRAWTLSDTIRWDFRGLEYHLLHNLMWLNRRDLFGHDDTVNGVAFFPDGEHLVTGSKDKKLALWNLRARTFDMWVAHDAEVTAVVVTPDGSRILSASARGELALWDAKTRRKINAISTHADQRIRSLAISPDGTLAATAGDDDTVCLRTVYTMKEVWSFNASKAPARAVAFHPKQRRLAAAGEEGRVVVLDLETGKEVKTLDGPPCELRGVAYSADGKWIATANANRTVTLWDADKGELVRTIGGHSDKVNAVAFSPTAPHLLSVGEDNSVRLWNYETGQPVRMYYGHGHAVRGAAFAPDGRHFVTGGQGNSAYLWDSAIGQEPRALRKSDVPIRDVAFARGGILVGACGEEKIARVWNSETGELISEFTGHTAAVNSIAFSPDERWAATASNDDTVRVWDVRTGKERHLLKGHCGRVQRVVFHPRGDLLASSDSEGEVRWWNPESGKLVDKFQHPKSAPGLAFSPDGSRFASSDLDGTIVVREVPSGRDVKTMRHSSAVITLDFDDKGRRLAGGSWDGTGQIFDVASGERVLALRGHTQSLSVIAFAGDRLVSSAYDRTIKVWNGENGQNLLTLRDRGGAVRGLSFTAKGHRLATACSDGSVKLWDATPRDDGRSLKSHTDDVVAVAYSRDGKWLVTGAYDGSRLWSAETGRLTALRHEATEGLIAAAVAPDARSFATCYADGRVAVWEARTGAPLQVLQGPAVPARSLAFRDAQLVVAAFDDGQVMVWNISTGEVAINRKFAEAPRRVALSADASRLAAVDSKGTVTLWDIATGDILQSLAGLSAAGDGVALSADGTRVVASAGRDVILWDASSGRHLASFTAAEPLSLLSLSANGHVLAGGSGSPLVEVWDLDRDKHVRITSGHSGAIRALALSPDGKHVTTASVDTVAKVTNWEARAAREQAELARPDLQAK